MNKYQAKEVCQRTEIKMSQFQYWVKTGLVDPDISGRLSQGKTRLFSEEAMEKIQRIKNLLDNGMRLEYIRTHKEKFNL